MSREESALWHQLGSEGVRAPWAEQVAGVLEMLHATMCETNPPPLGVEVFWEGEKGGGSFRLSRLYLT